jgi:hypothetical protein
MILGIRVRDKPTEGGSARARVRSVSERVQKWIAGGGGLTARLALPLLKGMSIFLGGFFSIFFFFF